MNTILRVLTVVLLSAGLAGASGISMSGKTSWSISGSKCKISIGKIENQRARGSRSGTLRICLWATPTQFPERGYIVASDKLEPFGGGYYYQNVTLNTSCSMPNVTGDYLFTVSVEEYTNSGWILEDWRSTGFKYLKKGKFASRPVWKAPKGKVVKPIAKVKAGDVLHVTLQATQAANSKYGTYVPNGSQLKTRIQIRANGRTMVYGGSRPEGAPAIYRYSKSNESFSGSKKPVGRLFVDYAAASADVGGTAYSDYTLFFQKGKRGFFKAKDVQEVFQFDGHSWGIFVFK